MARLPRIAVVDIPYHVTQRGNARQFILSSEEECTVYLELLRKYIRLYELQLLGYCLMSNHVHLIVVPRKPDSLGRVAKLLFFDGASRRGAPSLRCLQGWGF